MARFAQNEPKLSTLTRQESDDMSATQPLDFPCRRRKGQPSKAQSVVVVQFEILNESECLPKPRTAGREQSKYTPHCPMQNAIANYS